MPQEEDEAKEAIEKYLGFPPPRMAGYHLAVKLFIRSEDIRQFTDETGNKMLIEVPDEVGVNDRYRSCTALVVSMGPDAYKGKRFEGSGPWCKVGDWVVIPRNEGTQIQYRGYTMHFIPDDRVLAIVEDPTYVVKC